VHNPGGRSSYHPGETGAREVQHFNKGLDTADRVSGPTYSSSGSDSSSVANCEQLRRPNAGPIMMASSVNRCQRSIRDRIVRCAARDTDAHPLGLLIQQQGAIARAF
jgi:hypothetical protein